MRKRNPLPIHQVRVASPCDAEWDAMYGNEVVRHCAQCRLNVYNLSAMTRDQAERLIFEAEGRLCVRFYRRKDGTVITQDCPVGLAAFKKRVNRFATAAASAGLAFLAGIGASSLASTLRPRFLDPTGLVDVRGQMVMGDMVAPLSRPISEPPTIGCAAEPVAEQMGVAGGIGYSPAPKKRARR